MKGNSIYFSFIAVIYLMACALGTTEAKSRPSTVLMIVGYDGSGWYPYVKEKGKSWIKISEIKNPIAITRQPETGDFFYKADNFQLYHLDMKSKKTLPLKPENKPSQKNNYTQLRADNQGVVMIKLIDGKSRHTQIISIDNEAGKENLLLKQLSSQFHPLRYKNLLFYAHVSCRMECEPLIQEVWRKNMATGKARQLSLLNAISYLHSIDKTGQYGAISSNQQGFYHIARINLQTGNIIWLTQGNVTDSYPGFGENGNLYFIRRTPEGSYLMELEKKDMGNSQPIPEKKLKSIAVPETIKKIRYLEISY